MKKRALQKYIADCSSISAVNLQHDFVHWGDKMFYISSKCSQENSEPCETPKIFAKIVNYLNPLFSEKKLYLNDWLGSECACLETTLYFLINGNISPSDYN